MNELRRLLNHQLLRVALCGLVGGLVPLQVMALDNMPTRLDRFNVWSNGNVVSTRYAHDAALGAIRHAQRSAIAGNPTTGGVALSKPIAINTTNGAVTATATQRIRYSAIARGLRLASAGPLGAALLVAGSVADLLDDANVQNEDGEWRAIDPASCENPGGCAGYVWIQGQFGNVGPTTNPSAAAACPSFVGRTANHVYLGSTYVRTVTAASAAGTDCAITYVSTAGSCCGGGTSAGRANATVPYGIVTHPINDTQLEEALALAQPSPEVLRDLVEIGDYVPEADPADAVSISAPQPSPTRTSTTTNPDGSTDTRECETIGILSAGDIRLVEECTVTHRDPSGTVTGTTSTTTDEANPQPQQEEERSMFCELFPNVLACAEFGDPDGDDIPTQTRNVDFEAENLFGGGSCPADTTITVRGNTITIGQWSTWCPYITTYVRPMVLLLAAFIALTIVARGMPE